MASRLREPTEQELRDLAMTLAGEIDQRRSPLTEPQTRIEAANILATVVNRFSTDEPMRFGRSQVRSYDSYSDVVRNAGQYNAWMGQHVDTSRRNYDANRDYWEGAVKDFFSGELQPSAPNATHYHADFITPPWSRSIERVAQAGPHIFYNDERYMGRPLGERRPSYAMAAPDLAQDRKDQPNPAMDLNAQELAAIAPPTPAAPGQMIAARAPSVPSPTARPSYLASLPQAPTAETPISQRTLGGYIGRGEVTLGPNAQPIDALSTGAQQMLGHIQDRSGVPEITINHGYRSQADHDRLRREGWNPARNSQHRQGNAVDISLRGLTPEQRVATLDAAIYGGARGIGATGTMLHADTRDTPDSWGYPRDGRGPADWVNQSQNFQDLQRGRQYFRQGTPAPRPSVLPERRDPRATDFGPLPAETTPRLSDTYRAQPSLPQPTYGPQNGRGGVSRPSQPVSGGSVANVTPRVNQGFNDALSPRSVASAPMRVSPRGSYGTHLPRRSPDQFQYATRTREVANPAYSAWESASRAPMQRSPTDFQYAPAAPTPPEPPRTITETYRERIAAPQRSVPRPTARPDTLPKFGMVPNPTARPNMGPNVGMVGAPMARSRVRSVPSPVAAPTRRQASSLLQAFDGFNDWIEPRVGQMAGAALGSMFGGPIGGLIGGFGGYGVQQAMNGNLNLVQGSNLPSSSTPNWQDNTGLPTYASVTGRSGGTGASAHDSWADSLGSDFY
ncbi:MAG: D-Ala-D-Ala carboxypeptidase family metallohydrolase [Hyphomicrobiales bacterium]